MVLMKVSLRAVPKDQRLVVRTGNGLAVLRVAMKVVLMVAMKAYSMGIEMEYDSDNKSAALKVVMMDLYWVVHSGAKNAKKDWQ